MTPEERLALQSIEKRVAMENELERRKMEYKLQKMEEKQNPPRKIRMRNVLRELKSLRTMLPQNRR